MKVHTVSCNQSAAEAIIQRVPSFSAAYFNETDQDLSVDERFRDKCILRFISNGIDRINRVQPLNLPNQSYFFGIANLYAAALKQNFKRHETEIEQF